ncbi:hypothetical protein SAMN05444858_102435 [Micromonospora avicenniae]|uniref:Uncharacterized protein n=2 Tax=Micromonospora avicenniae TaxID=1198245 RepID=A0A1N6SY17_9ACTN|nr:hypothetical protein SAMN05444858_102435 [Micromonospora avicenniae]
MRPLPYEDLAALLGLNVLLHGELLADQLPPDVTQRLIRRLTEHGPLPVGASEGDLSLLLHDLAQRLHWAMGHGDEYPEATARQTTYYIDLPSAAAVAACRAELTELGARRLTMYRPGQAGRAMTSNEHLAAGLHWQLVVAFPELMPSPSFEARTQALCAMAERHGGRFAGSSIG